MIELPVADPGRIGGPGPPALVKTKQKKMAATQGITKGILLFFQKTRTLPSRGVVTLFHLFTIATYGRNLFGYTTWIFIV